MRCFSAVILVVVVLFATIYHPDSFLMLLLMAGFLLGKEWQRLNHRRSLVFSLMGCMYIAAAGYSLWWLRSTPLPIASSTAISPFYVLTLFAMVWASDIGAYVGGKIIGGAKLWPRISPNKTWSGAVCGALFAMFASALTFCWLPFISSFIVMLAIGFFISVCAQLGDLLESHLKRQAGVKDSGTLIPGHGGVFDRVDALMLAAPCFALWVHLKMWLIA
jgi:phosphatidate cytidylyltransferase